MGELLISARLIRPEDLGRAMERQQEFGGRLGDKLIAVGAISSTGLEAFLNQIPAEPETMADTGISPTELMTLLVKLIHSSRHDFGRQMISPAALLNRWIVPMENRVDYLKLHTGKSFSLPFEAMVIFSTNLDPEDLMDAAFLRRLPYKIEMGAPSLENYLAIFRNVCEQAGLPVDEAMLQRIVHKVREEKRLELAAFHARFIIDQVIAFARFLEVPPRLNMEWVDYALNNLKIRADKPKALG